MAGRWRGMPGDWIFEALLIRATQEFFSYFSNPVNELPLTYHSESNDDSTERDCTHHTIVAVQYSYNTVLWATKWATAH